MSQKANFVPVPKLWTNKDRTVFGWMERCPRGSTKLVLSRHSQVALARENTQRLRNDLADRLEASGVTLVTS